MAARYGLVWLRGEAGLPKLPNPRAVRSVLRQLPPSEGASRQHRGVGNHQRRADADSLAERDGGVTVAAVIAVLLLLRARLSNGPLTIML